MYTYSMAKYYDSLHISMIVSLSPFINKKNGLIIPWSLSGFLRVCLRGIPGTTDLDDPQGSGGARCSHTVLQV